MDWSAAIERNREALKRVLAMLVAMVGVTAGPHPEARADPELVEGEPRSHHPEARAEGEPRRTLPRHLHRAVLRLLRPAEAAARRLVIASASGLVVPPPRLRKPGPKPATAEPLLRRFGIAVVMSPADLARADAASRAAARGAAARPRILSLSKGSLPLLDPLRPLSLSKGRSYVPAHAAPRILFPGVIEPFSLPRPPSPDDAIDAARLGLRLAALAAALDDLPGQAKRFARWKAARDAAGAQDKKTRDAAGAQNKKICVAEARKTPGRIRRISPLRSGRPPGGRLSRYDPTATHPRGIREIDEILAHSHALAMHALQRRDTS